MLSIDDVVPGPGCYDECWQGPPLFTRARDAPQYHEEFGRILIGLNSPNTYTLRPKTAPSTNGFANASQMMFSSQWLNPRFIPST